MEQISPTLRIQVQTQIYKNNIKLNEIFINNNELYQFALLRLVNEFASPDYKIIVKGDEVKESMFLYFIVKGKCIVQLEDQSKQNYLVAFLKEGQYFG